MKEKIQLLRLTVNNMLLTIATFETENLTQKIDDLFALARLREHLLNAENELIKLDKKYSNSDFKQNLKTIDKGIEILRKWKNKP